MTDMAKPTKSCALVVDDVAIDKALNLITTAKNPVAVTEYAGGDPRAVESACASFANCFQFR